MSNRKVNQGLSSPDWAEGSPPAMDDEPADERSEWAASSQDRTPYIITPKAETGVMEKTMILGGIGEDDNAQDARRTTAETRAVSGKVSEAVREPMSDAQVDMHIPSVLIVEDAFELAEILQITLRRLKLTTAHESFGERALQRFEELRPEIVLLDISLPDMPGWQVLENIKELSRVEGVDMPIVIVITALGDPANRLIGKLQGVYRYLIKPFTPREVEQIVREALSTRAT